MTLHNPSSSARPVVLLAIDWYLPAYRAGGPIRSVSNLISALGNAVDFRVVCGDRDLGMSNPVNAPIGEWTTLGLARVLRLRPSEWTETRWRTILQEVQPDRLYLNSLYSGPFSRLPWRVAKSAGIPSTLAPRGMLGDGALSIKPLRKKAWLWMQRLTGGYSELSWHASTEQEANEIRRWFPSAHIQVALNLPVPFDPAPRTAEDGSVHLLSVGRVHPIKNYRFGLAIAKSMAENGQSVTYRIVGPLEDKNEAESLRTNAGKAKLELIGATPPNEIRAHFAWSHLVLVPSFNENFGHAVAEAVAMARPVVVSDQTAWSQMDSGPTVHCLPLEAPLWADSIHALLTADEQNCIANSKATHARCLLDESRLKAQLALFTT